MLYHTGSPHWGDCLDETFIHQGIVVDATVLSKVYDSGESYERNAMPISGPKSERLQSHQGYYSVVAKSLASAKTEHQVKS